MRETVVELAEREPENSIGLAFVVAFQAHFAGAVIDDKGWRNLMLWRAANPEKRDG